MTRFELNGEPIAVDATPDTPLLWVLRDHLGMAGTKFGCGKTLCRACTHVPSSRDTGTAAPAPSLRLILPSCAATMPTRHGVRWR